MSEKIDQSSYASILAGVQKMRQDHEITVPEQASKAVLANQAQASNPALERAPESTESHAPPSNVHKTASSIGEKRAHTVPSRPENPHQNVGRNNRRNVHSYTQVQVAQSQKGNPLLGSPQMRLTPWSYNLQILLDYYINATLQVLFLSLKYHKLRPEYVWRRLEKLKGGTSSADIVRNDEALRVLLVVVDVDSPQDVLRKLSVICIKNDLTMVVAWSFDEAGNYVASLKLNEMARLKIDSTIQGLKKNDYNSNIVNSLTTVRAVNKTDVANLLANCKSFKNIVLQATLGEGLTGIQGLGGRKVTNLNATFSDPFVFNMAWN